MPQHLVASSDSKPRDTAPLLPQPVTYFNLNLHSVKGAGKRERSRTALGLAGLDRSKGKGEMARSISADPAGRPGGLSKDESALSGNGSLSRDDLQVSRDCDPASNLFAVSI